MPGRSAAACSRKPRKTTRRPSVQTRTPTYDEVLTMVRRFRDDTKRVKYAGPLMALLEAPNLKALEAQLVRVLTKAERKGTTLERSFAHFDRDRSGTISLVEFEDALQSFGVFPGTELGRRLCAVAEVRQQRRRRHLIGRVLGFIRSKQNTTTAGGNLRRWAPSRARRWRLALGPSY